ncbi:MULTISPECIES: cardiolipin synthase [Aminiphilus]|uniref:cardiolipin synthase n=1 Tax=Aminiphilus TaxID=290731 RepID=UPI000492258D|nr:MULTISPECIES: cardiolipin synthase [Aminiphilus]
MRAKPRLVTITATAVLILLLVLLLPVFLLGILHVDLVGIARTLHSFFLRWQGLLPHVLTLYAVLIGVIVLLENRNPDRTLAWILVLVLLPVVGLLLYLFLGPRIGKGKIHEEYAHRHPSRRRAAMEKRATEQLRFLRSRTRLKEKLEPLPWKTMTLLLNISKSPVTIRNHVTVLTNGNATFQALFRDIASAKRTVHLEYFAISNDGIGRKLKELLERKAREGVTVRLLYDAVGSWKLGPEYVQDLRDAGVAVSPFLPVSFPVLRRRFNYRNHRKIAVLDGRVGFVGGLNIGDTYLGKNRRLGFWRDTHLRIEGEGVAQLQTVFASDWLFCRKETIPEEELHPESASSAAPATLPRTFLQIVSSGPDTDWSAIFQGYFSLITSARKRLWITTPYFVPDGSILMALKTAALNGVDVRLLLPSKPDHFIVYWATRSNLDELLASGVRVFCYTGGFVHAKIVLADGVASVGTANMDIRSLEINFEVQSFIYDRAITARLEKDFLNDLGQSKELDLHRRRHRPLYERFLESTGRLFSSQL